MAVTLNTTTGNTQVLERNDFAVTSMICNAGGFLEPTIQKGTSLAGNGSTANPLVVKLSTDAGNDIVFGTDGGVKLDVSVLNHTVTGIWQFQNPVSFGTSTPPTVSVILVESAANPGASGAPSILVQGAVNKERIQARSSVNGGAIVEVAGGRGTIASPLYPQTGDILGYFIHRSYSESEVGYRANCLVSATALENFTATAAGSEYAILTTGLGNLSPFSRIKASSEGVQTQVGKSITFGNTNNTVQASSGGVLANTAGGADTILSLYTLPADAFQKTGDSVDWKIVGYFAATASAGKQIRLFFVGFSQIATFTQGALGATLPFEINVNITRYNATLAVTSARLQVGSIVSTQRTSVALASWNVAHAFQVILNGINAADVAIDSSRFDYRRAP